MKIEIEVNTIDESSALDILENLSIREDTINTLNLFMECALYEGMVDMSQFKEDLQNLMDDELAIQSAIMQKSIESITRKKREGKTSAKMSPGSCVS